MAAATSVQALGPSWMDPQQLINNLGDVAFWVVLGIIFAECGILLGFFLPGDSLLFITGLCIASGIISMNIWVAVILLIIVAIAGNLTGYWIGYKAGPALFKKPDSKLFRKEYVEKTHGFFEKYGARAIILARFVPIVRTFITAVAGIGRMNFREYFVYSSIGAVLWAGLVTIAGYFLGDIDVVKNNIEKVLILIVLLSVIPIVIEFIRHKRQHRA
ncbi:MAG: DedA family protein [Actinobacteria bacterium]|nr:DedA family protein [Actinomycetota bacterium]